MRIGIVSELVHERNCKINILEKILNKFNIQSRGIHINEFELFCIRQGRKKKIVEDCTCINLACDGEILEKIEVSAIELPYTNEELNNVSAKLLEKYMYSALKTLKELGIERFVFTDGIKEIFDTEWISKQMLGRDFSFAVNCSICELVRKLSLKCDINPLKTQIAIVCRNYNLRVTEILKSLVFETESIKIYTDDINKYSYVCEQLYELFGAVVDTYEYKSVEEINNPIICDFDNGILRFGRDIVITDIKYKVNTHRYNIKDIEMLDLINEKAENFGIKYCISEKNRLTI